MVVLILLIISAVAISLYEYHTSKDAKRLTEQVAKEINPRYGAAGLAKLQNTVMGVIVLLAVIIVAAAIGIDRGVGGFGNSLSDQQPVEISDTFQMTLNAPPVEPVETLPPSYTINDVRPGAGEHSEEQQAAEERRKSDGTRNDTGNNTDNSTTQGGAGTTRKRNSAEQDVYDFERKLFEEAAGNRERDQILKEQEENRRKRAEKAQQDQEAKNASKANQGGSSGAKGKTMVSYVLEGRSPFNNNISNIANPGYTCGQGLSGEVVIKIKVNSNGNVTSATVISNISNLNPCLPEQARIYALKSRFNPAALENQEGTITYRFVP